jgi:hypothetical protein
MIIRKGNMIPNTRNHLDHDEHVMAESHHDEHVMAE